MNNDLNDLYEQYDNALQNDIKLREKLASLGEIIGNGSFDDFNKVKSEIKDNLDLIEKLGNEIAKVSTTNSSLDEFKITKNDTLDEVILKLDKAVKDNKITQEEADNLLIKANKLYGLTIREEISRLEEENENYQLAILANESEKKLLIDVDDAKDLHGHDEAIRQLKEHITSNENEINDLKEKLQSNSKDEIIIVEDRDKEELNREEIFTGSLILDGLRSNKSMDSRVIDLMHQAGVTVGDDVTLEINYEGANDNDGLSEVQTTNFSVFAVKKNKKDNLDNKLIVQEATSDLEEIKNIREKIDSCKNDSDKEELIANITEKIENLEEKLAVDHTDLLTIPEEKDVDNSVASLLAVYDKAIAEVEQLLEEQRDIYQDLFQQIQDIYKEEVKKFESSNLFSVEEADNIREEFNKRKAKINTSSISTKENINALQNELTSLKRKRRKLEKDILTSNALGISLDEYHEITNTLRKRKIMNAILSQKGLDEIVEKKANLRTKEENKKLREAKNEVLEEISNFKKANKDKEISVLDSIEALYNLDSSLKLVKSMPLIVSSKDMDNIHSNVRLLPEKIVSDNHINNKYMPRKASLDMLTVRKDREDSLEKIVIYKDLDNNSMYVKNHVIKRFNLDKKSDEVKIDNFSCYKIDEDDANYIIGNANNNYSPYQIDVKEVNLGKKDNNINNQVTKLELPIEVKNSNTSNNNLTEDKLEKIVIYKDQDNLMYVKKYVTKRFNLDNNFEVKIDNFVCSKIDEDDANYIIGNANNSYSPYQIEVKNVILDKKNNSNNNPVNNGGNTKPTGNNKPTNSKPPVNSHSKPHVEAILQKLTKDLTIKSKDSKRYTASNIKVSKNFVNELHSGNYAYNIVHVVPATFKAIFSGIKKLSSKLLLSSRGKEAISELKRRLDEDLSDEELQVLFDEYRGSVLKTDMNNQINSIILNRLKRFGLEKVEVLNNKIKNNYSILFTILGEVKVIDNQLLTSKLSRKQKEALIKKRVELISTGSSSCKEILKCRKEANTLLSGGVHGLEEDFKAVASKLSYVGMRFGKNNNFDNELQDKLGQYGQGLNDAIFSGDNEAILSNFMGLESCYYKNTEVSKSLVGKRSVGSKYYTPLAEEFDYRDDPFIRDLFTTIAITSSAVSAINAIRVHQIEANNVINKQNENINNANNLNDQTAQNVRDAASDIESRRSTFQNGMEAQAHQDVVNSANMIERGELDMSNWSFGKAYHAADSEGHDFSNTFGDNIDSQINQVASQYGSGVLTQAEALQKMADISSDAQATLANVSSECLSILEKYAESHPQFDLSAVSSAMKYINSNPTAISEMNQSMVDVTNIASGLAGLSIEHVEALSSLPSDMLSTLVCAASAAGLALKVSSTMSDKYTKKNKYGNDITEMMDEYINGRDKEDEEENIEDVEENHRHR
jgi:hypothetical protein